MSLTVSVPVKKRQRRKELDEEIVPKPGTIAAWERVSGRYILAEFED